MLKVNIDGSYNSEKATGGLGYVIRDHDEDVVVVGVGRMGHAQDALQQELGIHRAMVENSRWMQFVGQAIKSSSYDLSRCFSGK